MTTTELYQQYVAHIELLNSLMITIEEVHALPQEQMIEKLAELAKSSNGKETEIIPEKFRSLDNDLGLKALRLLDIERFIEFKVSEAVGSHQAFIDSGSSLLKLSELPIFSMIEPVIERMKIDIANYDNYIKSDLPEDIEVYRSIHINPSFSDVIKQFDRIDSRIKAFTKHSDETDSIIAKMMKDFGLLNTEECEFLDTIEQLRS